MSVHALLFVATSLCIASTSESIATCNTGECALSAEDDANALLQRKLTVEEPFMSEKANGEDKVHKAGNKLGEQTEKKKTLNKRIVILGDSMGERSGTSLASFCPGATVYNAAIGGSTADDWSTKEVSDILDTTKCPGALNGKPDFIWLTIGGNDNFNAQCGLTSAELAGKITAAINQVKSFAPGVKILMVGYPMAVAGPKRCKKPQNFAALSEALHMATDGDADVFYIDSVEAAGGSSTAMSDATYFQDAIHLNNKGYCKVFTQAAVQTFLGCAPQSYDCDTESCNIPGLDRHCNVPKLDYCPCCSDYCQSIEAGKACNKEYKESKGADFDPHR